MKIALLITIFFLVFALAGLAQSNNATLKGVITDQAGKPLDMVNVSLKDYALGTSSKRDGTFVSSCSGTKKHNYRFFLTGLLNGYRQYICQTGGKHYP